MILNSKFGLSMVSFEASGEAENMAAARCRPLEPSSWRRQRLWHFACNVCQVLGGLCTTILPGETVPPTKGRALLP